MKYIKYIALVFVAVAALGFYYVNKPKKDITGSSPDIIITTNSLLSDFQKDENAANTKYLDKIIETEGVINSISTDKDNNVTVLLATDDMLSGISCQLEKNESVKSQQFKEGDKVKIKGICTGMLMDVVLVNCVIEI